MAHPARRNTEMRPCPAATGLSPADQRVMRLVEAALCDLQLAGRRAVRIVDAGCGSGAMLFRVMVRARMLGFVAIEGRGFDISGEDIGIARRAARGWKDPAIGLSLEVADIARALEAEEESSVDILLCARGALERLPIAVRRTVAGEIRRVADLLVLKGAHPGQGEGERR